MINQKVIYVKNAKEKEPRIGLILEKTKRHILVNVDNKKYKVYPDRILFRYIQ